MTKNEAIVSYLKAQSKVHGIGTVILLPEFVGSDESGWLPSGEGVRGTKKDDTSYIRLGAMVLGDGLKMTARYTNTFMATTELNETLDSLSIVCGGKVPGKLIAHERLTPFRRTNGELDIKYADRVANIACTVDDQPIYRRIEHTTDMSKADITVQHTNGEFISNHARTQWMKNNANPAKGLENAAANAKRIAEIKAIAANKRTAEQKMELMELLEA